MEIQSPIWWTKFQGLDTICLYSPRANRTGHSLVRYWGVTIGMRRPANRLSSSKEQHERFLGRSTTSEQAGFKDWWSQRFFFTDSFPQPVLSTTQQHYRQQRRWPSFYLSLWRVSRYLAKAMHGPGAGSWTTTRGFGDSRYFGGVRVSVGPFRAAPLP